MQGLGQTGGCWKCVLLPTSGWMNQIFLWRALDISVSLSARRYLGAPIKLVLGLTLDSAWDLSLGSKAGTTLGRCRQLWPGYSPTSFLGKSFLSCLFSEWRCLHILQNRSQELKLLLSWVKHPGHASVSARAGWLGGSRWHRDQCCPPGLAPGQVAPATLHIAKRVAPALHLKIPSSWEKHSTTVLLLLIKWVISVK